MEEVLILILEIVLLVVKLKLSPEDATRIVSEKSKVAFSTLWEAIPKRWK